MCLRNIKKIETEGKDITVYKVLAVLSYLDGSGTYLSPYKPYLKDSAWNVGETNVIIDKHPIPRGPRIIENKDGEPCIQGGAFHSFANLEDAIAECKSWGTVMVTRYVVAECIIPKDTKYLYSGDAIAGDDENNVVPSYASQSLRLVRIIPQSEIFDALFLD